MKRSRFAGLLLAALLGTAAARAADTDLAFSFEIGGDVNIPTITVTNNSPTLEFNVCYFRLNRTDKNFDGSTVAVVAPVGGGATQAYPLAGTRTQEVGIVLSGFGPGKSFSFRVDIDRYDSSGAPLDYGEDYSNVFFNNGAAANASMVLVSGPRSVSLTLDDRAPGVPHRWRGPKQELVVESLAETNGTDYVRVVEVKVDDGIVPPYTAASRVGEAVSLQVPYGSDVEITAPRTVYKDINGADITSSVSNDHSLIEQEGEERFTALGISVNDVPQTADPSLYRFEMLENTQVELRWEHEYALTVRSNFDNTRSTELLNGQPLAGPLASQASGNPVPLAQKHWIKRGTSAQAQIDGSLLELLAQPGLDIRYVVESFRAYGPPNSRTSAELDRVRLSASDGGTLENIYGAAKSISAYAASGSNLKLTVNAHGLSTGMRVRVAGTKAGIINYDGNYDVTVVDGNNFTVPVTHSGAGSTSGTALRLVDTRGARTAEITAMAASGSTTRLTSNGHGLRTGAAIVISGCSDADYNGEHTVTLVDANTISIPVPFTSAPVVRGTWTETTYLRFFPYSQVAPRQVAGPFNMWGPAGITWHWKIQYGVRVNADAATRNALPTVYEVDGSTATAAATQDGVYWFDPGKHLRIYTDFRESTAADAATVNGWLNGDGYYFPSIGNISSSDGTTTAALGSNVRWQDASGGGTEVGLEIFQLNRPARVLWRYGNAAYAVNVIIGQYVWEGDPALGAVFTRPPGAVDAANATFTNGVTGTPGPDEIVEWDPVAGRLYPLLPGIYTVPWKPGPSGDAEVSVLVTATLPVDSSRSLTGHYPHVADSPPVALDPDPNDNFTFRRQKFSSAGAAVDGRNLFTATSAGFTVLQFSEIQRDSRGLPREFLKVRVVDTKVWNDSSIYLADQPATVGTRITDTADAAQLGTGFVRNSAGSVRFNPFLYNAGKLDGLAVRDVYDMQLLTANPGSRVVVDRSRLPGPVFPVNKHPGVTSEELLTVVWYDDPARNDLLLWPHRVRSYTPQYPGNTDLSVDRIVISTQWGSESPPATGSTNALTVGSASQQIVAPAVPGIATAAVTYDPSRLQAVTVYQQPDPAQPGYNPNEEHALIAPSLRYADVSPRPPAVYALRENDLNTTTDTGYTSDPFVLVQFFDTAIQDHRMKLYRVAKEDQVQNLTFAAIPATAATPATLNGLGHVEMEAGEPVIPFYPLGVAIGAAVPDETFGNNLDVAGSGGTAKQLTYWEDHKGSSWAVSGGANAWFTASFYYPLAPDFYWPEDLEVPPVRTRIAGAVNTQVIKLGGTLAVPLTGDAVAFLPPNVNAALTAVPATAADATAATTSEDGYATTLAPHLPIPVLFHAEWPANPPVLKAGETLTFSGGENRADNPTTPVLQPDGSVRQVETPGLPQVLAFASAEVVFDSQNPTAASANWLTNWTGRVAQALDVRRVSLPIGSFPAELQPAGGKTRVSQGKFIFNDLPASLQKRLRYDPIGQRLELTGLVNDKGIGANDLTAAPPAVYVLEPNILTADDLAAIKDLSTSGTWDSAADQLYYLSRDPENVVTTDTIATAAYTAGLVKNSADQIVPARHFGPGLALIPSPTLLDPTNTTAATGWITVVENNDPALGGAPITPHIIKVDRTKRYRGSVKVILSDNVFDENVVLRHTGDFGANPTDLYFEWWYRPDDGSLNVPPPDLIPAGTTSPWKLFPDTSGGQGHKRNEITLKGNPNAPEALLADTWWFCRYRHRNDAASGSNWKPNTTQPAGTKKYEWAGAGNNDPFHDFDLDGVPDYRAQLAMGWIKRVLDAVNPYEARIRDFEGENPATITSMIAQFGPRFEGPVALNPAKDVIENVGLIELYETVLKRGRDLSIDLSRPVSTPAVANALQLVSTRISDFYTLLGNEAWTDAQDPTIGFGSDSVDYGSLAPAVFAFQNQMPDLIGEELSLLRGVDDFFARPVYNRLFWNFTKAEGEAAYAMNYNMSDVNRDGFVDEDDAMKLFPMGHGDAWGHYLTAVRKQYALLGHPFFNWVSRSESYNLQDIVITVDFLDERKFAATAAAKAKAGAEIVNLTYRDKYVEAPEAQWQGYTDSNPDRAWGVDEWARRAGQGAYFDWVTANALLPSEHPNTTLEGVRKVDRQGNSDIAVISANLSSIQTTMDHSNRGQNPLGLSPNALTFDFDPFYNGISWERRSHFEQLYDRAVRAMESAQAIWDNANEPRNMLRQVGNSEVEFRNSTFQEDLSYRNQLIQIFGKPYEGTIGSGQLYPAGYDGPDVALFMYVPTRQINYSTVPGPVAGNDDLGSGFGGFDDVGELSTGDLYNAFNASGDQDGTGGGTGAASNHIEDVDSSVRGLFASTFSAASNMVYNSDTRSGLFAVNYTDLETPKVPLTNFIDKLPITAAGYTFQAPAAWGIRRAPGELQSLITQMLVQEAAIIEAVGAWDALTGQVVRTIRLVNARLTTSGRIQIKEEGFVRAKYIISNVIKGLKTGYDIFEATQETVTTVLDAGIKMLPSNLPTGGLAISPGDALAPARGGLKLGGVTVTAGINGIQVGLRVAELVAEIGLDIIENELNLFQAREERDLQIKEWLKELEDLIGDEPIRRVQIFKEIQTLHDLSGQYRAKLDEGMRLIDERAAFNKRVAAQTQRQRYSDMTFRVARNHALQSYRSAFELAARYSWLTARAYDYETNFDPSDPGSAEAVFREIVRARTLGNFDGDPRFGAGGLSAQLAWLKTNYDGLRGPMGLNNPQVETGKLSLRRELLRILPSGSQQPQPGEAAGEFPAPGMESDSVWRAELEKARVPDLWDVPEFRYYCRPFAPPTNETGGHVPQPGLVFRFGTEILAGKNFFGRPLSGGDHAYDPSNYATKVSAIGVWFSDYLSSDVLNDLASAPRVYLMPAGTDIMRVPRSPGGHAVRRWNVLEQVIPIPLPGINASINTTGFIPLLDTINGPAGDVRQFSSFRAYHNGEEDVDYEELIKDSRLVGRSVWNTQWVLIIPGQALNADPNTGIDRFTEQVSDIKLVFETFGMSGG